MGRFSGRCAGPAMIRQPHVNRGVHSVCQAHCGHSFFWRQFLGCPDLCQGFVCLFCNVRAQKTRSPSCEPGRHGCCAAWDSTARAPCQVTLPAPLTVCKHPLVSRAFLPAAAAAVLDGAVFFLPCACCNLGCLFLRVLCCPHSCQLVRLRATSPWLFACPPLASAEPHSFPQTSCMVGGMCTAWLGALVPAQSLARGVRRHLLLRACRLVLRMDVA